MDSNRRSFLFFKVERWGLLCFLLVVMSARADIKVDGILDDEEWSAVPRLPEWQRTYPFSLDAPRYENDVRIVATPAGLAAAFLVEQPPEERRVRPRVPRDADNMAGEWVTLMIDFDAAGQTGYEFTVGLSGSVRDGNITNQNVFNRDWDGVWKSAVRETDTSWVVEMLIPWSTVNMRSGSEAKRTIGVYAARYLRDRDELYSSPGIVRDSEVFLSQFRHIEIDRYETDGSLDIVPYAAITADQVSSNETSRAGLDVIWKPNERFQLAATVNPDFGQVESDELVVNFSAIETFFTDKRPFFTENQAMFDVRTPASGQLIYTRRIGDAPDDLSAGSSNIDAAIKATGSAGALEYGLIAAQEEHYNDDLGRLFTATRVAAPVGKSRIGYLGTWTDRPFLSRTAFVNALDYSWNPTDQLRIAVQAIRSDISELGSESAGYEEWMQVDINGAAELSHSVKLLNIDKQFDMNDMGYLARNSLRQGEWETVYRSADATQTKAISGHSLSTFLVYRENQDGERLKTGGTLAGDAQFRNGWLHHVEFGYSIDHIDDLISRGNGPVEIGDRALVYVESTSPRIGNWQFLGAGYVYQQGVSDYTEQLLLKATWFASDELTLRLLLQPEVSQDWLLWRGENLFGSYRSKSLTYEARIDWIPYPRHEIRLRWQWVGIDADLKEAYRSDERGNLHPTAETLTPFTVSNLGVQVRYRYEIGPMSDLYVVYGRGGFDRREQDDRSIASLYGDMFDVRDVEQLFVKLRYRF